jgi:hypothetical protein
MDASAEQTDEYLLNIWSHRLMVLEITGGSMCQPPPKLVD